MYSCLWEEDAATNRFFLGASLGGCVFGEHLVGSWPTPVKRGRYRLVGGEPVTLAGWSFKKRPEKYQTIGNCAETYPILHLMRYGTHFSFLGFTSDANIICIQWT